MTVYSPEMIVLPIETGVLIITESNELRLLMLGSVIVTVVEFAIVEKFGAAFDMTCCGVTATNEPLVITFRLPVVPANKCFAPFKSCHAWKSRGVPEIENA